MPRLSSRHGALRIDRTIRMTRSIGLSALLAFIGIVAAPAGAAAADISILGKWEIVEAAPGPWTRPEHRAALVAEGKHLLNLVITFTPAAVISKFKLFNCKRRVVYEPNALEVDALFQGNLPEPNPAAAAAQMGFPKGDIPGIDVKCINAQFTFHFRDPDTEAARNDFEIAALDKAVQAQLIEERNNGRILPSGRDQRADAVDAARLLRARGERRDCRRADQCHELSPPHRWTPPSNL